VSGRGSTGRPAGTRQPETVTGEGRRISQLAALGVPVLGGVGSSAAKELAELGVDTVLDLVTYYPRRYIDGTRLAPIAELREGDRASVLAEVTRVSQPPVRRQGRGRRPPARVELVVADESGRLSVVFFNQTWRARQLPVGTLALLFGSVGSFRGARQMVSPVVDVLRTADDRDEVDHPRSGRIFTVYPLSERANLTSARISRYVHEALDRAGTLADPLSGPRRRQLELVDRTAAFNGIHRPATMDEIEPARRRLAFDELLRLQLALVLRQHRLEADARGIRHAVTRDDGGATIADRFVDALPFRLTAAQQRAIATIGDDLAWPLPMHRLLQGDVGSGKTVVAVWSMLVAVEGGHQGALMAPTEVLAEQHAAQVRALVHDLAVPDDRTLEGTRPLRVVLLTSRTTAAERTAVLDGLADGSADIVIGTHALLTEDVSFRSLGVAVIDEQHRFGVEQRAQLRDKGSPEGSGGDPDLLVMTATPIPRTAAMIVFGDLDMTVVDELPPGRQPVQTVWVRPGSDPAPAWEQVRTEVAAGHRAFVVCPLVEGSERVQARSVTEEAERLMAGELAGLRVGILHGQLRAAERDQTMDRFRSGAIDVLVATTVIEVGVDVPDATVMVIEDADRFGIAQLHQLRGRVGRGSAPSWCYLLSDSDTPEAEVRLSALERTTDGFELADVDLELRGEGTILGARQKGRTDLKLARLTTDRDLVSLARGVAEEVAGEDPALDDQPLMRDDLSVFLDEDELEFLFKS
jgi:ATP-dependent DNA helicase RecG